MIDNTVLFLHSITIGYRDSRYIFATLQTAESAVTDIRLCRLDWKNFFFLFKFLIVRKIIFFFAETILKNKQFIFYPKISEKNEFTPS